MRVVKAYKAAKLEEIVEIKSELVNVADLMETEVTNLNIVEQLQELKAVTKGIKDATIRDLVNVNDRTKALETNKIWASITG